MAKSSKRLTKNNFTLLRFLFAGTVCLVHSAELSWFYPLYLMADYLSSAIAVKGFFVISGFLIFMSYERSSSLFSYVKKRIRRIYPAYCTVIVLCAFGFAIVSSEKPADYFSFEWIKYLIANLTFLNFIQDKLPGVFMHNKIQAVNGALWTLKVEMMFYCSVPFFVFLFRKFSHLPVLISTYLASVIYSATLSFLFTKTGNDIYLALNRQLPAQLAYFISGAFFYYYLPLFERRIGYFLFGATTAWIIGLYWLPYLFAPFSLAALIIFFSLFFYLGDFGKYGDISYGIYILHFPIIQLFHHYDWFISNAWLSLASTTFTIVIAAFLMWHLVEKKFLHKKNHSVTVKG